MITGAAQGIGEAITRAFIAEGAIVCLTDINDAAGRTLAVELGARAAYRRLDVRLETDWEAVVDALLAAHRRVDVIVNNAGVTGFEAGPAVHDPEHAILEDWRRVHEINLDGVFPGLQARHPGDEGYR